ncbi:kinase domain protein [Penicillium sp. IBT 16267x]|nr:kinase domain protein [Penicillium sp. IBT 16267x]
MFQLSRNIRARFLSQFNAFSILKRPPSHLSSTYSKRHLNALEMDPASPVEEESLPFYQPEQFYPVKIGELLNAKYRVIGKLGYGSYSTMWLCRDAHQKYVAVKVLTSSSSQPDRRINGELDIYRHLSRVDSSHVGNIKASNIMLSINDPSMLEDFEAAELQEPSPRKSISSGRIIYKSRKFRLPRDNLWGQPVLCDLGQAKIGSVQRGLIQPNIYKAPEVLFDMEWSYSVDIWNIGAMIWDIFEGRHLFNALDEDGQYSASHHVAEMVAYMGLPSVEFLKRSPETQNVFDKSGRRLDASGVAIPNITFDAAEKLLRGKSQALFLNFIRSMLQWEPEYRKPARALLEDPWLNDCF